MEEARKREKAEKGFKNNLSKMKAIRAAKKSTEKSAPLPSGKAPPKLAHEINRLEKLGKEPFNDRRRRKIRLSRET